MNNRQKAADWNRGDTQSQFQLAWSMLPHNTESEILIALERQYFLNRKEAQRMLSDVQQHETRNPRLEYM